MAKATVSANSAPKENSTSVASIFIILIIFIIFFGISFMIQDTKYRICYYMILALLFLASLNIYLSIVYYIQLRNTPGVQGPIGSKGPKGMTGTKGRCSFSVKCGIDEPRKIILDAAHTMYNPTTNPPKSATTPDAMPRECLNTPSLANCNNNQDTLDQARPINNQINMLEKIAQSSSMTTQDFKDKINVCLTDSDACMEPTDF